MSEHITHQPAVKRLERSRSDRMAAGVCGGLARYFDFDAVFFRVGFVVLTLLGGAGILIYAAAVLVVPDEGSDNSIAEDILRSRKQRPWRLIALGLVAAAVILLLSRATLWPRGDAAWVLLLLAGAFLLYTQRRRPPAPAPPPSPVSTDETVVSTPARPRRLGRAIAIGASIVVILLLAGAATVATVFHVNVGNGIGSRTYRPAEPADLQRHYRLGIGELKLDLGRLRVPPGETDVDARVGIGDLEVTVPAGVAVQVNARTQIGTAVVLGRRENGRNARVTVKGNGRRVLVLNTRVGLGALHVERSVR